MAAGQCCHLRKAVADVKRRLVSALPFGLGHDGDVCEGIHLALHAKQKQASRKQAG